MRANRRITRRELLDLFAGLAGERLLVLPLMGAPHEARLFPEVIPASVEILLPELVEGQPQLTVRYCDTCRRWGQRHSVHLCGTNWHHQLAPLVREIVAEICDPFGRRVAQ
jgi:hypothetical protein